MSVEIIFLLPETEEEFRKLEFLPEIGNKKTADFLRLREAKKILSEGEIVESSRERCKRFGGGPNPSDSWEEESDVAKYIVQYFEKKYCIKMAHFVSGWRVSPWEDFLVKAEVLAS